MIEGPGGTHQDDLIVYQHRRVRLTVVGMTGMAGIGITIRVAPPETDTTRMLHIPDRRDRPTATAIGTVIDRAMRPATGARRPVRLIMLTTVV